MRILFFILLLIILLVAVSWFRPAYCNEPAADSLIQQYLKAEKGNTAPDKIYKSPPIFDNESNPADSQVISINAVRAKAVDSSAGAERNPDDSARLKPFGYDLFETNSPLASAPEIADAADYILGPGDNIIIYLWGKVEKEFDLTVDRQGKIFIPKAGEVVVWGKTLSEFEKEVNRKFSAVYSDFKSSISLGKIRSIRIYLTGEVKKPGAYTVSSLTTLFNALYLAGGPNERGSMRGIQLVRNNKVESSLDLYQFLLKGDNQSDIRLSSGDAIFVPVCGPRVTVAGEIKRPALYELLGGEKVDQVLDLAGGSKAEAFLDRIALDRISDRDERIALDLNMNPGNGKMLDNIELKDGDRLTVPSRYNMKRNIVWVAGMVKHPGSFERNDSTTLAELVKRGELLPENVYYQRANLFRRYPDRRVEVYPVDLNEVMAGRANMLLQDLDSLHIYSIDQVERKKYVYIEGEVRNPGEYPLYDNMSLADLIFLAGNFKKNAYQLGMELARTDSLGQVHLDYVDLTRSRMEQLRLQEDDRVFVRQIPDWFLHRMVTIEGEVKFPGQYALFSRNETLSQLLQRAGGFTDRAFPKGIVFQRANIGNNLRRRNLDEVIANTQPMREDSTGNIRKVELIRFNPETMNRLIIDMDKIIESQGTRGDITLQSGDYVYVPELPSGISVLGSIGANGTIKYEKGKNVNYYVQRAGNFTSQSDKKGTRLIKADGRVFSGNGTLGKKVEIGDAIVVPTEIKKDRDWMKILSSTVSIIGGLATTVFVIGKL